MKFNKFWSNSGELNFNSTETVIDFIASSQIDKPLSNATAQPNNRQQTDGRLNLSDIWTDSGVLNFGVEGGNVIVRPDVDVIANSTASIAYSEALISNVSDTLLNSEYLAPTTEHEFSVNINVNRDPKYSGYQNYQSATAIKKESISLSVKTSDLDISKTHTQSNAKQQQKTILNTRYKLSQQQPTIPIYHHEADKLSRTINHFRRYVIKAFIGTNSYYMDALSCNNGVISRYKLPPKISNGSATGWQDAELLISQMIGCDFNDAVSHRHDTFNGFQDGINATGKRPLIVEPPTEPELPIDANLIFKSLWDSTGELDFLRIELDALIVNNIFNVYHVNNETGLKTTIKPTGTAITFNIDSFAYNFTGLLIGDHNLPFIQQDDDGAQKFEVFVNGHTFNFRVRSFSRAREIGGNAFRFTAVSSSQFLSEPWATKRNINNETVVSAFQLAEQQMPGFTIERYLTPDWTLEAESINESNATPMSLLNSILSACGAIVQPDLIDDKLHIQPRYKSSAWSLNSLLDEDCDHVVPELAIAVESGENNETPEINSVLISGEDHGVITIVDKSGTDGSSAGEDVVSQFSQDHNVNVELARNIFSDSGKQEVLGIKLPLLPPGSEYGLCLPGEIIRLKYDSGEVLTGICLDNNLAPSNVASIWQTVKMEVNHGYN